MFCRPPQDQGDPAVEVSPRDLVFALPADEATSPSAAPRQLAATNLRYGGISWGDGDLALIYESWWKTRRSIVCTLAPDRPQDGLKVGCGHDNTEILWLRTKSSKRFSGYADCW